MVSSRFQGISEKLDLFILILSASACSPLNECWCTILTFLHLLELWLGRGTLASCRNYWNQAWFDPILAPMERNRPRSLVNIQWKEYSRFFIHGHHTAGTSTIAWLKTPVLLDNSILDSVSVTKRLSVCPDLKVQRCSFSDFIGGSY